MTKLLISAFAVAGSIAAPSMMVTARAAEGFPQGITSERPFLNENDAIMIHMMAGMAIKPSGDVDHDFAGMMIPHHQGAIDMAVAELRYGHNEQLKRIAQEIIVDQQQEIAAMHMAIGEKLPPAVAAPTQPNMSSPLHGSMSTMETRP